MSVAVIIAAKDASATIARAIRSALAEPQVTQVIVVDDGSADDTAGAARAQDDGTGRLSIERFAVNQGPSAARNHALDRVTAEHVAILDSDDFIAPGRFGRLLAIGGWDVIADNILFVPDGTDLDAVVIPAVPPRPRALDLAAFIDGCVDRRSRARSQLGFLKPVIRSSLLSGVTGRKYDEHVRLGEDFLLYAELLRDGARFMLTSEVGYVAVERGGSLSARHGPDDLLALLQAERGLATTLAIGQPAAVAMARRVAETGDKHALRAFLQARRQRGVAGGLAWLAGRPASWRSVVTGVARDKAHSLAGRVAGTRAEPPSARLLLT